MHQNLKIEDMQTAQELMFKRFGRAVNGLYLSSEVDSIMKEYALLAIKEDRENVAENASSIYEFSEFDEKVIEDSIRVDRSTIINAPYPKL